MYSELAYKLPGDKCTLNSLFLLCTNMITYMVTSLLVTQIIQEALVKIIYITLFYNGKIKKIYVRNYLSIDHIGSMKVFPFTSIYIYVHIHLHISNYKQIHSHMFEASGIYLQGRQDEVNNSKCVYVCMCMCVITYI